VRGDVGAAVDTYLAELPGGPEEPGAAARRAYAEHHDPARALREFPPHFRFERQLLDHLARGQPPERALRALSRELRLLFVHAYQALVFNRWVSRRVGLGLSLAEPEEGDVLLRVARDGTVPGTHAIPVRSDNLPECGDLVRRGRALVAGPLVGFETPPSVGRPGAILEELLAEEGITRRGFEVPSAPDLASRGTWRPALVAMPPIALRPDAPTDADSATRGPALWFDFALPKGSYATVLLREFTKTGARPAEGGQSTRVF